MTIRLIAGDFDETLSERLGVVLPEVLAAIRAHVARGGAFLLASGRITASIEKIAAAWDVPCHLAAANGAVIESWPERRRLRALELAPDLVRRALALGEGRGEAHLFFDECFHARSSPEVERYSRLLGVPFAHAEDLAARAAPGARAVIWRCDERETPHLRAALADALDGEAFVTASHARLVDCNPAGAGKDRALACVQEALGIAPEETLGLGDSPNDLGLFAHAAHRGAPANAHPALKARATFVAAEPYGRGALACLARYGVV
ncbi:MAG TPA: hypothetical protein DCM87_10480 [Planctomycetes bacterium]|nr:hypothetical protein [Planctomycetota bacterium]